MKNVCFSVYSQALKQVKRKPLPTCLTGFGPISAEIVLDAGVCILFSTPMFSEATLYYLTVQEQREASQPPACHIYNPLYVLKSKPHTETATSNLDTLFCAYCLSHDNNWAIVGVTDGSGNLLDTAIYAIDEPSRWGELHVLVFNIPNIYLVICLKVQISINIKFSQTRSVTTSPSQDLVLLFECGRELQGYVVSRHHQNGNCYRL